MKSLVCAFVILAVIITGGMLYTDMVINLSEEFSKINYQIITAVKDDDFDKAVNEWNKLDAKLKEKKTILSSNIDHSIIDGIEQNLVRVKTCLEAKEKSEVLTYAEILDFQLSHLPRNFILKAENIL